MLTAYSCITYACILMITCTLMIKLICVYVCRLKIVLDICMLYAMTNLVSIDIDIKAV